MWLVHIRELENRLLEETKAFYGNRLVSVVLFGSVSRKTQRFDSDMDVFLVVRELPDGRMKRIRAFDAFEKKLEPLFKALRERA